MGLLRSVGAVLVALAVLTSAGIAAAQNERPSDAPIPSCLDQSIVGQLGEELRPRGVQKRPFTKDGELELSISGGLLAGDLLSSSYIAGGAAALYFTEDLAVEVGFHLSPIELDLDEPLAEFFGDDRFEPGMGYLATAGLLWSPIHAKMRLFGSIVHSDIQLAAGVGRLFHDSSQGLAFDAGFVVQLYTTSWVTFKIDIRDVIMLQEAVSETRLTNNIRALFGVSLWIPVGL